MYMNAKKIHHGGIEIPDFIFDTEPLDQISEYQRVVVCMVSTVNLNSTILLNEDLIEDICLSTGLTAACCTFGISVNIFCHSIQNEGSSTFITLIIRTFNCLSL